MNVKEQKWSHDNNPEEEAVQVVNNYRFSPSKKILGLF
jgi:hypothetical protein